MINWEDFKVKQEPYKFVAHGPWIPIRGVGKSYCLGCGLVNLNNAITSWCVKKGCNSSDHPQYKGKLKQMTRMD